MVVGGLPQADECEVIRPSLFALDHRANPLVRSSSHGRAGWFQLRQHLGVVVEMMAASTGAVGEQGRR